MVGKPHQNRTEITVTKNNKQKIYDLTHAQHDRMHCLVPGLFRSLKRGERKKEKLDITYNYPNKKIRFTCFEPLGADDMKLLQFLVALGGVNKHSVLRVTDNLEDDIDKQLIQNFVAQRFEEYAQIIKIKINSIHYLIKEMGLAASGNNVKRIKENMYRLKNVTIEEKFIINSEEYGVSHVYNLISEYLLNEKSGYFYVALNPMIASAILGKSQFSHIDLNEIRSIKSAPTAIIHQHLCGWIDPGKAGNIGLDVLCSYPWPDEATNPETLRTRKLHAKKALKELSNIGWTITEIARNKWEIARPNRRNIIEIKK